MAINSYKTTEIASEVNFIADMLVSPWRNMREIINTVQTKKIIYLISIYII